MKTTKTGLNVLLRSRLAQLIGAIWHSYRRTNCSQMAAGVALFAMLSLLPLMVLMVSVLAPLAQSLIPTYDISRGILHFAQITVSPIARQWLQDVLQSFTQNNAVVSLFTFLAFVWAASNVFSQLDASFHRIWRDGEANPAANWRYVVFEQIRRRRNAFLLLLLGIIYFVGTSLIGRWATEWTTALAGRFSPVQQITTSLVAWLEGALFLALLYWWLLPGKTLWLGVLVGAIIAAGANLLVRVLVTNFVDTTIGATSAIIGGPLALMLGVYLVSQNVLIGAIVVRQYGRARETFPTENDH
jgi:membrane protein